MNYSNWCFLRQITRCIQLKYLNGSSHERSKQTFIKLSEFCFNYFVFFKFKKYHFEKKKREQEKNGGAMYNQSHTRIKRGKRKYTYTHAHPHTFIWHTYTCEQKMIVITRTHIIYVFLVPLSLCVGREACFVNIFPFPFSFEL